VARTDVKSGEARARDLGVKNLADRAYEAGG
jgi:hypothetical protein